MVKGLWVQLMDGGVVEGWWVLLVEGRIDGGEG